MFIFNKKNLIILIIFIIFINNFTIISLAQESSKSTISIETSTKNPTPGENVNIKLNSYSINLDTSKISWYIDGVFKKEGIGQKETTIKAKKVGQHTTVKAIITAKGESFEITTKITPITVSLIMEPQSYTPFFYKGKPNFPYEGTIKIIALPEIIDQTTGKKISIENLIFRWLETGVVNSSYSGLGKNYIIIKENISTTETPLTLEIYDKNNNFIIDVSRNINSMEPEIIFYEDNPIYGTLYNKAVLEDFFLGDREEITIKAEPFYFDSKQNILDLIYTWKVNNKKIDEKEIKEKILLKKVESDKAGTTYISLEIDNNKTLFQNTKNKISIKYNE